MDWCGFRENAPELAAAAMERFERSHLVLLATLRFDGWPRISPVEPLLIGDELVFGMIWQSKKALDLLREPRCALHSVVTGLDANEGEFKLRGLARSSAKQEYFVQIRERWGVSETVQLHVFCIDVIQASLTTYDFARGLMLVKRWSPDEGVMESARHYP